MLMIHVHLLCMRTLRMNLRSVYVDRTVLRRSSCFADLASHALASGKVVILRKRGRVSARERLVKIKDAC